METEVVVEILLLGLGPAPERTWAGIRVTGLDFLRHYNPAAINRGNLRNSYAPPVSGAELRSAHVGAKLGRPVNAAVARFLFFFV
jgi:hypothetical protein